MPPPKMKMKSTVNRTGWMVTSENCMGSREMCTRLRRVMAQTSRDPALATRPAPGAGFERGGAVVSS